MKKTEENWWEMIVALYLYFMREWIERVHQKVAFRWKKKQTKRTYSNLKMQFKIFYKLLPVFETYFFYKNNKMFTWKPNLYYIKRKKNAKWFLNLKSEKQKERKNVEKKIMKKMQTSLSIGTI